MTRNMGTLDRAARLVIAAILIWLAFGTGVAAAGILHWLAIIVAVVFAVTAIIGNCPAYSIVGVKTCKTS